MAVTQNGVTDPLSIQIFQEYIKNANHQSVAIDAILTQSPGEHG